MKNIKSQPEQIPAKYRPVPFWSWNDKLEPEELLRQIRQMHTAGLGGFFMHARGGLLTPYMGEEWMNSIVLCVREAVRLGMKAYLYDENGWPSGFGNGMVNGMGETFQQKYLRYAARETLTGDAEKRVIKHYSDGFTAYYDVNPYYVDNMDPQVVDCFLEKVYDFYWQNLPEDVRENLAGIFTDEPQLSRNGIPWSLTLEKEYRKVWNEDLLDKLPELFKDTGDFRRTRIRYYQLCASLFRKSFIEKVGDWCRRHNWELTGHHVLEENYLVQLTTNGAIMPQFTGYSIPGVDHLRRTSSFVVADIQTVSVAAQLGKPQILTETFGCSGWNFNFHGMNWLYQQQMVHGVNLLCQHLEGYSIRGMRKRDYPASIFYQHPMWKDIKILNDSFARTGRMLAEGEIDCSTLVLHGQSTAWMYFAPGAEKDTVRKYFTEFEILSNTLDSASIPFHYGDELLLSEYGSVEDKLFRVGKMTYKTVVIPPVENISAAVWQLVCSFYRNGGKVLRLKNNCSAAFFIDGEPVSEKDAALFASMPVFDSSRTLIEELRKTVHCISCRSFGGVEGQIRGTWRNFPEYRERWYFIADFDNVPAKKVPDELSDYSFCETLQEEKSVPVEITLPYPAQKLLLINKETGGIDEELRHINIPGSGARFLFNIPASGSLLIQACDPDCEGEELDISGSWQVVGHTGNYLTIDRAEYRTSPDEEFQGETDTLAIFNRLLKLPEDTPLELRYNFTLNPTFDFYADRLQMVVEPDDRARYFLNGREIASYLENTWCIDRSFRVFDLDPLALKHGKNVFEVRTFFSQRPQIRETLEKAKKFEGENNKLFFDSEVEAVYLRGNFGCFNTGKTAEQAPCCYFFSGPFEIAPAPAELPAGELLSSGYPFFSGEITLEKDFVLTEEQVKHFRTLRLSPFRANSVEITLNGKKFPVIWSAPYELYVRDMLQIGKNTLKLTLTSSMRNTLGPLHTAQVEPLFVGPFSFLTEKSALDFNPPPHTEDYGFIEPGPRKIVLV